MFSVPEIIRIVQSYSVLDCLKYMVGSLNGRIQEMPLTGGKQTPPPQYTHICLDSIIATQLSREVLLQACGFPARGGNEGMGGRVMRER